MNDYENEISRSNVTLEQFFKAIRASCEKKGIPFSLSVESFKNPKTLCNCGYYVKGGVTWGFNFSDRWKTASPMSCAEEKIITLPFNYHFYTLEHDGSCFEEIARFTNYQGGKGSGFYHVKNIKARREG
jgi:hypothetical protein